MRGFRDRMFGDSFDTVEAYILRHGESRDSHWRHGRDFMRGFKGGMFGGGFRTGRKFDAADLQLIILALLSEQPRHGYELIKTLEERSGGFYVPSPGVIYPALTYLEETGPGRSRSQRHEEALPHHRERPEAGRREPRAGRGDARQAGCHRRKNGACQTGF